VLESQTEVCYVHRHLILQVKIHLMLLPAGDILQWSSILMGSFRFPVLHSYSIPIIGLFSILSCQLTDS